MALLHTGRILAFGGSGNDEFSLKTPKPAEILDLAGGTVYPVHSPLDGDVFCAGHAFLPDGRLLVAGGTHQYDGKPLNFKLGQRDFRFALPPFSGLDQAYLFDPESEGWMRVGDMAYGRWYPTLVGLPDGSILAAGGLTMMPPWSVLRTLEVFSGRHGWRRMWRGGRWLPLYPRLHLLPSGEILYAGSYNTHYTFPFHLRGFPTARLNLKTRRWHVIGPLNESQREEGASVLLPLIPPAYTPQVVLMGGGTPLGTEAVADVELIDLSKSVPTWRKIDGMKHPRYYCYAVILPDRRILVLGGRRGTVEHGHTAEEHHAAPHGGYAEDADIVCAVPQDPLAVGEAELFDPERRRWETVAAMHVDRLYHSNALLHPDGRIVVAGSNPGRRIDERCIEIYRPPYLFSGSRPEIERVPARVSYGGGLEIATPDATEIDAVALIRPSATTHCLNPEQRYVGLEFGPRSREVVAMVPENRSLIPPGYYMVFVVTGEGVPSVGRFVHIS